MPLILLKHSVRAVVRDTEDRYKQGGVELVGIPTGFHLLDQTLLGLREEAVYLVAGRPGMGKTSFAMNVAMNVAAAKRKVFFASLEMSAALLTLRVISGLTGVPARKIETGTLTPEEWAAVAAAEAEVAGLGIAIDDDNLSSEELARRTADFKAKHGLDLLVIDYVSRLTDRHTSENERLTAISNTIATLAKDLKLPVLLLAQLNREVEKREGNEPTLSDLRGSGSLEQDAFAVIFPMRPHYYAMMHDGEPPLAVEKDARVTIAKNRQGEVGRTGAWFHADKMLWTQKRPEPTAPPAAGMAASTPTSLVERVKARRPA